MRVRVSESMDESAAIISWIVGVGVAGLRNSLTAPQSVFRHIESQRKAGVRRHDPVEAVGILGGHAQADQPAPVLSDEGRAAPSS